MTHYILKKIYIYIFLIVYDLGKFCHYVECTGAQEKYQI